MEVQTARGIPLRARDGTIRAFAMVDAEDYERFCHERWHRQDENGYAVRDEYVGRENGRSVLCRRWLHREILGARTGEQVDHENRDKLDCRRSNLRVASRAQNAQNVGAHSGASSRYRGVSWQASVGKWKAQVRLDGALHYLGLYSDEGQAARVAAEFRAKHMPFATE